MKTDVKGCSTCEKDQESYERFYNTRLKKEYVQYDYRAENNKLFTCVAPTIEKCREKRDTWLFQFYEFPGND